MEGDSVMKNYVIPKKLIKSPDDMPKWEKSEAYQEYLGFIQMIGDSISGKKIRDENIHQSDSAKKIVDILEQLSQWIDEIKPIDQQQRFGNKAFRDWYDKVTSASETLLKPLFSNDDALRECQVYFHDSFGNSTRIDYGTGHEMAFIMFLACLFQMQVLKVSQDAQAAGLVIFSKYMNLVRKLQITYRMEPAGSQGVWSLDDFQFVSFIWGAAQFMNGHDIVSPKAISDYEKAEQLKDDYLFFACIQYISEVKTGPFAEHSNQLWNVSGVPSWNKVFSGLIKMYRAEVISKFPIIQHTYFGSIFKLDLCKNPIMMDVPSRSRPKFNPANMPPPPSLK